MFATLARIFLLILAWAIPLQAWAAVASLERVGAATVSAENGITVSGLIAVKALDMSGMPAANAQLIATTQDGCGKFSGSLSASVVTDAQGIARTPAFTPDSSGMLACSITVADPAGSPGVTFGVRRFDPAMLRIFVTPLQSSVEVGVAIDFTATVSGGGLAFPGLELSWVVLTHGADATLAATSTTTDGAGRAFNRAVGNMTAGTYSVVVSAATSAHNNIAFADVEQGLGPVAPTQRVTGTTPSGGAIAFNVSGTTASCVFKNVLFMDLNTTALTPVPPPTDLVFPHGLVLFRAEGCGAGQPVTFTLEYASTLPANATLWRYGFVPNAFELSWYSMPATVEGNKLTFTVVDGGLGDNDSTQNGTVLGIAGIAVAGGDRQDLWWSGIGETGWGMSIIQHRDALFTNLFAYDAQGNPVWYVMPSGTWNAAHTAFTGSIYQPKSSPFFAYDVTRFDGGAALGTATITFSDANTAVFDYTINGVTGRKRITRILFGPPDALGRIPKADLWWGGTGQNGWGIAVLQQFSAIFSLWFTYDANGAATWYVMPGGSWTHSDTYEGRIYRALGPPWLGVPYDVTRHRVIDVGSFRLRFVGDTGTFEYTVDGRTGTLPLTRVPF